MGRRLALSNFPWLCVRLALANRTQLISKGNPMKREEAIDVVKSGFEKLEESLKQGKSDALLKLSLIHI